MGQFGDAGSVAGDRLHDGRRPAVLACGQGLQCADFTLDALGALAVALVDDEDVGDFHNAGFDGLDIVAHAGYEDHHSDVGQANDVDFILADSDRFDQDEVASGGIQKRGDVGGGAGQSSEGAARGHAADVDAGVAKVVLHADAVAENRAAGVGAGGIDGDDGDRAILLAIKPGELIDQCALPCTRRTGHADDTSFAGVGEHCFEQIGPSGGTILNA